MAFEEKCVAECDDIFIDALEENYIYTKNTLIEEINQLRVCSKESKLVAEFFKKHVLEKKRNNDNLELEIVSLRKEIEKIRALNLKFSRGYKL